MCAMKKRNYVGAGGFALNMRGHRRQSSSIAYLHPFDATAGALRVYTSVRAQSTPRRR